MINMSDNRAWTKVRREANFRRKRLMRRALQMRA
jgi:hypothetical protein